MCAALSDTRSREVPSGTVGGRIAGTNRFRFTFDLDNTSVPTLLHLAETIFTVSVAQVIDPTSANFVPTHGADRADPREDGGDHWRPPVAPSR